MEQLRAGVRKRVAGTLSFERVVAQGVEALRTTWSDGARSRVIDTDMVLLDKLGPAAGAGEIAWQLQLLE